MENITNKKEGILIPWVWIWAFFIFVFSVVLIYFGYWFYFSIYDVESRIAKKIKDSKTRQEITTEIQRQINQEIRLSKNDSLLNERLKTIEEKNKIDEYIDKKVQESTKQVNEKLDFWGTLGVPFGTVALISILVAFYSRINPILDQLLKEKTEKRIELLDEQLAKNQESFNEIIKQQNVINEIERKRKILIISEKIEHENKYRKFFEQLDFAPKNLEYKIISNEEFDTYINTEPNPRTGKVAELLLLSPQKDLIIFDDRDYRPQKDDKGNSPPNPRDKYITLLLDKLDAKDAYKKTFFLYFGASSNAINKRRDIAQAANSEMTLYSRILEALIYQHTFKLYKNN